MNKRKSLDEVGVGVNLMIIDCQRVCFAFRQQKGDFLDDMLGFRVVRRH